MKCQERMMKSASALLTLVVLLCGSGQAFAQSPLSSNVALQPSKDGVIIRQQFRFTEAERSTPRGDFDIRRILSVTTVVYGLTDSVTVAATLPYVLSRHLEPLGGGGTSRDEGFGDTIFMTKLRVYRDDFGVNDTARFDVLAGVKADSGNSAFASDSVDPIFGGVWTLFSGRSSFDADFLWQINTDHGPNEPDLFRFDGAYLYRISPETYQTVNPHALFGSIELNGIAETNGDRELFLSPGIQFVTQRWALEATVQLPVWQELDHRAEADFIVGIGMRWQF